MTESPEYYELFHYGVKGMKWGVRKDSSSSSSNKPSRRERNRENDERVKALRADLKSATEARSSAKKEYREARSVHRKTKTADSQAVKDQKKAKLREATSEENRAYLAQVGERTTREKRIDRLDTAVRVGTAATAGVVAYALNNPQKIYDVSNGIFAVQNKRIMKSGMKAAARVLADSKGLPPVMTIAGEVIDR